MHEPSIEPTDDDARAEPLGAWLAWIRAAIVAAGAVPIAVFLLHVVLSRVAGAYLVAPWLDLPMHVLGGAAIAWFFRAAVEHETARPVLGEPSRAGRAVLTFALVATAAVVWEFAEWTGDRIGLTDAQAGLDDTMLDLFLGLVGGALLLLAIGRRVDPSHDGTARRRSE